MRKYLLLIFIVLLFLCFRISFADNLLSPDSCLKSLSKFSESDTSLTVLNALWPLYDWGFYLTQRYQYFATLEALDEVEKRTKPYREKVYRIVPKFLQSKSVYIRETAAKVLAYYKWSESFKYLVEFDKNTTILEKCVLFAILGDKRAIPIIIQFYNRPKISYEAKINCLNALYHLASPEILPFIDSVIAYPKPPEIKKRAKKVKKHTLELYPDEGDYYKAGIVFMSRFEEGGYAPIMLLRDIDNDGLPEIVRAISKRGEAFDDISREYTVFKFDSIKGRYYKWQEYSAPSDSVYFRDARISEQNLIHNEVVDLEVDEKLARFVPSDFLVQVVEYADIDLDGDVDVILNVGRLSAYSDNRLGIQMVVFLENKNGEYYLWFIDIVEGSLAGKIETLDIDGDCKPEILCWAVDPGGSGYTIILQIYRHGKIVRK